MMNKTLGRMIILSLIGIVVGLGGCEAYRSGHDAHTDQEHAQFLNRLGESEALDSEMTPGP